MVSSSDVGRYTGHWTPQRPIRPSKTDHVRVTRSYRSTNAYFQNTVAVPQAGAGFSFKFDYDGNSDWLVATVNLGSPINGTSVGVSFPNFSEETHWLQAMFRYVRITKLQMTIVRAQQSVMVPTMVEGDGSIVQVGMAGNGSRDPGRILIRPWAGQPDMASMSTGVLTEYDWTDNYRRKVKVTAPAASPGGVQKALTMTVSPVQVNVSPNNGNIGDGIVSYIRTPTCEWSNIVVGASTLNSYGFIYYWNSPGLVGAITGMYKLDVFWEFEVEWFGLMHPEGVPAIEEAEKKAKEEGVIFSDSKEALIAEVSGQKIPMVDRAAFEALRKPAPQPPPLISIVPDLDKERARENQQAAVQDDYVQIPKGK